MAINSEGVVTAEANREIRQIRERESGFIFAWFGWFAVIKRRRATAVQDAGAFTVTLEWREASWSAPALWCFGRWRGGTVAVRKHLQS